MQATGLKDKKDLKMKSSYKLMTAKIGAYILLRVAPGQERKVYEKLKRLKEITLINLLFGEWDIIVGVNLNTVPELETFVLDKIRTISEIGLTSTMIVAK